MAGKWRINGGFMAEIWWISGGIMVDDENFILSNWFNLSIIVTDSGRCDANIRFLCEIIRYFDLYYA